MSGFGSWSVIVMVMPSLSSRSVSVVVMRGLSSGLVTVIVMSDLADLGDLVSNQLITGVISFVLTG